MVKKVRLGDLLLHQNVLTQEQIAIALESQKTTGLRLGHTLVDLGLIDEPKLLQFLAEQLDIPYIDLKNYSFQKDIIQSVPEILVRRFRAMPIACHDGQTILAMVDPTDVVAFDAFVKIIPTPVQLAVVKEYDFMTIVDDVFRRTEDIKHIAHELKEEMGEMNFIEQNEEAAQDAPILKLLNSIFEDAVQIQASDIHIEPDKDLIRIRYRVDGVLSEQVIQGKAILSALILRLKLMAKLNISERRLPQDGRFALTVKSRKIDVRLATMPVDGGEAVVMRLFDQGTDLLVFDKLGMPKPIIDKIQEILSGHHGMILVTGPTGSGKSTTLYTAIEQLNVPENKIITVEDPVEYMFERVNQVQVQPGIGLNFSKVLRTALRHDPDVIMVGEIRDEETATIALRAAITGHLVLTTLHTNNAISSPGRLLDMGVPGYLVASALKLVIAQRLIRRLCTSCQEAYQPTEHEIAVLDQLMGSKTQGIHFVKGKGCNQCHMSGYKGRIGIYEVLEMNREALTALREHDMNGFVEACKTMPLYRNLTHWALDYACMGLTSIHEVFRLTQDIDES